METQISFHVKRSIALVATLAVSLNASISHAQQSRSIDLAQQAYDEGKLDLALQLFESAKKESPYSDEELVAIHLHIGILRGARGEAQEAKSAFKKAFALNPQLEAPPELSPSLRAIFFEAKSEETAPKITPKDAAMSASTQEIHPPELVLEKPYESESNWFQSPWFWIGTGAVLAVATTIILLVALSDTKQSYVFDAPRVENPP
ncbi:MAG: hypothetical protein IPJ88_17960 [Myxococcales bacterium]|nr:MAG: hypothetical protein IPJ88_17960 [Myxococcales bacterium]